MYIPSGKRPAADDLSLTAKRQHSLESGYGSSPEGSTGYSPATATQVLNHDRNMYISALYYGLPLAREQKKIQLSDGQQQRQLTVLYDCDDCCYVPKDHGLYIKIQRFHDHILWGETARFYHGGAEYLVYFHRHQDYFITCWKNGVLRHPMRKVEVAHHNYFSPIEHPLRERFYPNQYIKFKL